MRRLPPITGLVCVALFAGGLWASAAEAPSAPEQTRAVSLKVLQARLKRALAARERPSDLLQLCGITKLLGYVVDEQNRDLILLGEVDPQAPALQAEDLAVALRSVWLKYATRRGKALEYANPGCSIDPDPAVIRRLREISVATQADRSRPMEAQMEEWCAACEEPQQVRVMGVPFHTRFAKVMVDADYLMKSVVNGSLEIPGFASLTDMTAAQARQEFARTGAFSMHQLSLNRFWFYPGEARFEEQEGVVTIEECPVVLLTEEQHLTRGGIAGLNRPDPMAQRFAEQFSAHYADIAAEKPIYLELEGLFRWVAFAKLLKYQRVQTNLDYLLQGFPVPKVRVAASLPGVSRVTRLEGKPASGEGQTMLLWLPSCGGVDMDVKVGPSNFKRSPAPRQAAKGKRPATGAQAGTGKKAAILRARPSPDALYWDVPATKTRQD